MRKYILIIMLMLIFVFSISGNVFATETLKEVFAIRATGIETPYLGEKIDMDAEIIFGECTIKKILWYKDKERVFEDTFLKEGEYVCKIYFEPFSGYTITDKTYLYFDGVEPENILHSQDYSGHYIQVMYQVKPKTSQYPETIAFNGLEKPTCNQKLDYDITSNNIQFYNYKRIEWYSGGRLLSKDELAGEEECICKIYLDLYNGFEYNSNLIAYVNAINIPVTQDISGLYLEVRYTPIKNIDEKSLKNIFIDFNELPEYGKSVNKIIVKEVTDSPYFEIASIEWYRNGYRMLDEYFYDGDYRCRIYFNFVNGGYPASDFDLFVNDYLSASSYAMINNRYYTEKSFNIQKSDTSTFKFDGLNIPAYGGIQDSKINPIEPGLYTPSLVYWYKDGKYMSNIETFSEGIYKCKFSLTLNSEMAIPSVLQATINGEEANIYFENNKITIDKNYEVKKVNNAWTKASDWAIPELNDALNNGLIPDTLNNKNYTQNITRAEFAAVAVKLYERIALRAATPISNNPFTDTNDVEILKAYALGITNGTSATTFSPNNLITRQEMATMMVRALDKADVSINVNLNTVKKFADHTKIDSWALNGVYFMSDVGIIKGKGNNTFDVLGNATREEALAISIRSVNKYK